MALVDRHINDFLQEVKKLDPDLRRSVNMSEGLFYVQMGDFRAFVERIIQEGRFEDYDKALEILDRYFEYMDRRLENFNNAVYVSFLEHLFFDSENGLEAWNRTPDKIQEQYNRLTEALEATAPKQPKHLTRKEQFHARKKMPKRKENYRP